MLRLKRGQKRVSRDSARPDSGFTLVELMVVVLIIGILVAIAIPVYAAIRGRAQRRACFANQRTITGAIAIWLVDSEVPLSTLAGPVDDSSPLMSPLNLSRPPRCPSAVAPAGLYSIDTSGNVVACVFGDPVHGSFLNP